MWTLIVITIAIIYIHSISILSTATITTIEVPVFTVMERGEHHHHPTPHHQLAIHRDVVLPHTLVHAHHHHIDPANQLTALKSLNPQGPGWKFENRRAQLYKVLMTAKEEGLEESQGMKCWETKCRLTGIA
jgi:hypothetical protein